jgi:hypothetical protein
MRRSASPTQKGSDRKNGAKGAMADETLRGDNGGEEVGEAREWCGEDRHKERLVSGREGLRAR